MSLLIFSSVMCIYYLSFCYEEGNIFHFYYKWVLTLKSRPLRKILGECIICHSFYVCNVLYLIYYFIGLITLQYYLPFIFSVCGLTLLLFRVQDKIYEED